MRMSSAPPMDYVACLDINLRVHPVHWGLFRVQFFDNFMLFSSIVPFNVLLLDIFLLDKLRLVLKTCQNNFIPTQVNNWIGENVNDLCKHLLNQFVSLIQSNIQRPHVPTAECAGYVLVLWCFAPTGSVTGSVKLWDDSNTSDHCVSDELPGISAGVGLLWAE